MYRTVRATSAYTQSSSKHGRIPSCKFGGGAVLVEVLDCINHLVRARSEAHPSLRQRRQSSYLDHQKRSRASPFIVEIIRSLSIVNQHQKIEPKLHPTSCTVVRKPHREPRSMHHYPVLFRSVSLISASALS
jgi:hypothetical protein